MSLGKVIGDSWVPLVGDEFSKEYLQKMAAWLTYQRNNGIKPIYPASEDVFRSLKECPATQTKVVIIGKSPYYQPGVADGIAFSYKDGIKHLQGYQALDVILDEIERDCYNGFNVNKDYDLTYLAKQGVLLLNSVLTVFKGDPDSHKDIGWQTFVARVIQTQIIDKSPKVFILMGNEAKQVFDLAYNPTVYRSGTEYYNHNMGLLNKLVIKVYHPAYDLHKRDSIGNIVARYPDGFTSCGCFSKANEFLIKNNIEPIEWLNTKEPFFNPSLKKEVEFPKGYPPEWDINE